MLKIFSVLYNNFTTQVVLVTLQTLRSELLSDGFEILGYFGSRAREEESAQSDLDLLYCLHDELYSRYPGREAIGRIEEIRTYLTDRLNLEIDLANRDGLNRVSKKYILRETVYVA
jgi:predicted nucleotidyltransferase